MNTILKWIILLSLLIPSLALYAQPAQTEDQIYEFIALDEKPEIVRDAQPVYPQNAIDLGVEGTVVVSIVISRNGTVESAEIFNSVPQLDNAALQAARRKVFSPGVINGSAVRTRMNIPIEFNLSAVAGVVSQEETTPPAGSDVVDLTGEAVIIKIEPERPRVNIIADRIKPEFDMMNLDRTFLPEITGASEKIIVVEPKARINYDEIDINKVLNRSR
jgi:TonB family protein